MASTFLKPTVIARAGLGLLQREIVLPRLVWSFGASDFAGAKDDTITLRIPAVLTARDYEWRTRTNPIVFDDLTERGVDVKLDKHPYSAVAVTDEQLTLDIASFGAQVLQPQVRAVAEKLEGYVAAAMAAAPLDPSHVISFDEATDDPYLVALEARRVLNLENVPMADRFLVLGSNVETAFLASDRLTNEVAGDGALRDASIGRVAGFSNIVVSQAIDPDTAYAFHRTAVAFANAAPTVPDGATYGSSQNYGGLAMRWIRDYDPNYLRDRSVVSAFAGASSVNDGMGDTGDVDTLPDDAVNVRLVKIDFTAAT